MIPGVLESNMSFQPCSCCPVSVVDLALSHSDWHTIIGVVVISGDELGSSLVLTTSVKLMYSGDCDGRDGRGDRYVA